MTLKKWDIVGEKADDIISVLLENRKLTTKKEIDEFLNPKLEDVTIDSVGIDPKQLKIAIARIKKAIADKEQIIVYGDYDVDGICGAAILWETLHRLGAKVLPYIPHRIDEGYGLSEKGILDFQTEISDTKLIITVDNGIVANDAVEFAEKQGIDVIITDHHVPSEKLPKALAIVHTTKLCGTGVGWMLARDIRKECHPEQREGSLANASSNTLRDSSATPQNDNNDDHLELVALATIADLVPLVGANRTLTKFGLKKLQTTRRVGLLALYNEAGIDRSVLGTYEVGHQITPRLNAMGRLESAMDSLRLLCTKDHERARTLAGKLNSTNKERQVVTEEAVLHAKSTVNDLQLTVNKKLIFIADESYPQGVIGLVAGKLVEEFYRPAIVIAKGDEYSKASARSVHGFNIIEFIRTASDFLVDAGGHPMAAGFTVETTKLALLQTALEDRGEKEINEEHLIRLLRIDCEIDFSIITDEFFRKLEQFEPFGMGNPQPTFVTKGVLVEDMRLVGQEKKHVKFRLSQGGKSFGVIAFGFGARASEFTIGAGFDIAYTIDEDKWPARNAPARHASQVEAGGTHSVAGGNGNRKLQLKIKDLKSVMERV